MKKNTTNESYVDIKLSRPIFVDDVEVKALRMREPTVADQIAMDEIKGSQSTKEIGMFANLCLVSPDDLAKLPLRDYKRLQEAFVNFIG